MRQDCRSATVAAIQRRKPTADMPSSGVSYAVLIAQTMHLCCMDLSDSGAAVRRPPIQGAGVASA